MVKSIALTLSLSVVINIIIVIFFEKTSKSFFEKFLDVYGYSLSYVLFGFLLGISIQFIAKIKNKKIRSNTLMFIQTIFSLIIFFIFIVVNMAASSL